jgi:hypothetical protein
VESKAEAEAEAEAEIEVESDSEADAEAEAEPWLYIRVETVETVEDDVADAGGILLVLFYYIK